MASSTQYGKKWTAEFSHDPFHPENMRELPFHVPSDIVNNMANGNDYTHVQRLETYHNKTTDQLQVKNQHYLIPVDQFKQQRAKQSIPVHDTQFLVNHWTFKKYGLYFIGTLPLTIALYRVARRKWF